MIETKIKVDSGLKRTYTYLTSDLIFELKLMFNI